MSTATYVAGCLSIPTPKIVVTISSFHLELKLGQSNEAKAIYYLVASNNFLEDYPLYRKLGLKKESTAWPHSHYVTQFLSSPIHMSCLICTADRTFTLNDKPKASWQETVAVRAGGSIQHRVIKEAFFLPYTCTFCNNFTRTFTILGDYTNDFYIQKIGQYPAWDISIDKTTADALKDAKSLFQNGLVCESQGYGVAAYAYYRRIVEVQIDTLLDEIAQFLSGGARGEYEAVLSQVRNETVAAKKIELAKELLPDALRPNGLNPLDALYVALSEGIHQLSDEDCLELASAIRSSLVYLIKRTTESRRESDEYASNVQKILDRRKGKG